MRNINRAAYIKAYLPIIGVPPKPAEQKFDKEILAGLVWMAKLKGHSVGVIVLRQETDHLMVYSIAVHPDAQGKGIGKRLLKFAVDFAKSNRVGEITLYTNSRMTNNIRLYESMGFRPTGRRPHPSREGETLVDMSLSIRKSANDIACCQTISGQCP